jgi:hypothetical protein
VEVGSGGRWQSAVVAGGGCSRWRWSVAVVLVEVVGGGPRWSVVVLVGGGRWQRSEVVVGGGGRWWCLVMAVGGGAHDAQPVA